MLGSIIAGMFKSQRFGNILKILLLVLIFQFFGTGNRFPATTYYEVRDFTWGLEFDYVDWTLNALRLKFLQFSSGTIHYLDEAAQKAVIEDYLDLVQNIQRAEAELNNLYADPAIENPDQQAAVINEELASYYQLREVLGPLAENVIQGMMGAVLKDLGLSLGGQSIPPLLYHSSPLPWALIVSPRQTIQQDAHIHLKTETSLEEHIALEDKIAEALDVSTLVVPIGGVGVYPTMVAQTRNLPWLAEVVAHEWIHNYLDLHPLGQAYSESPELRTINETTASIAGTEIGHALISRFFADLLVQANPPQKPVLPPLPTAPVFDFRAEMHETRVTTDALLANGEVEAAEAYMEARRIFFWENGYKIRKLNQAYFAFHGAYASQAVGAAGEDPVGEAVRSLRDSSATLEEFLNAIAWVNSFEELLALTQTPVEP